MCANKPIVVLMLIVLFSPLVFSVATQGCDNIPIVTTSVSLSGGDNKDIYGAPRNLSGSLACIVISGSNLVFDCNGHNIFNNGTAGYTYGIYINGTQTNVTIENCGGIHDYYGGIWSTTLVYGNISNNVVYNNSNSCIYAGSGTNYTYNTVYNCTRGFDSNGQFGGMFARNTVYNNSQDGFYIFSGSNCVLTNNTAYNNSHDGFYLYTGSNCAFTNNTASNNSNEGFELRYMTGTNITNNTASNNNNTGFDCGFCHDNIFIGNKAYGHAYPGFYLAGSDNYNNTLINNTAYNNYYGINPYYSYNSTLTNNTAYNNTYGIILSYGSGNNLTGNTVYNNTYGVYLRDGTSANTLSQNIAHNNSVGFEINTCDNNTLSGNTAYYNTQDGFDTYYGNGNVLSGNTAYGNPHYGFYLYQSTGSTLSNNRANVSQFGFLVAWLSNGNTLTGNTANANSFGFDLRLTADNNNLTGNTAYNNSFGFDIISSANNNLTNSIGYNNTARGVSLDNATGSTLRNTVLYSDGYDVYVDGQTDGGFTYSMVNTTLLNPSGTLANYTALSVNDSVVSGERYSINWSSQPPTLPGYMESFAQKFVNITPLVGTPSIDRIVWSWQVGELTGDPAHFQLWRYDSGWANMNATLDTVANTLALSNVVPASVYGILQLPNCLAVNSSYTMTYSFFGAPNSASPLGGNACVVISASDLVFDCDGYGITSNGTGIGILLNGSSNNVTVKNCRVLNYSDGYYLYYANNSVFTDDVADSNQEDGIAVRGSSFNSFTRINSTGNPYDFDMWASSNNNTITDSWLTGGADADDVADVAGSGNVLRNIAVYSTADTAGDGAIYVSGAANNTLDNITISHAASDGIYFTGSCSDNVVMNSKITGTRFGVNFKPGSSGNTLTNNRITGASSGGVMFNASSGAMSGNTISGNAGKGVYLNDSNITMSGDRFYNNGQDLNVTYTSPAYSFNATAIIFDNPSGNMQSYTTLSLTDPAIVGSYGINWSPVPALPANFTSFAQKFVNITATGAVFIDSITWGWNASETTGYNESLFSLWELNDSGWMLLNGTPDIAAHTLGLTGLTPGSIFGILYNGTYTPPTPPAGGVGGGGGGEELKHFTLSATEVCPDGDINVYAYTSSGGLIGANVRDVLYDPYEGLISQDTTDSTGHVVFHATTAGTYTFSASKPGYMTPSTVNLVFTPCGQAPPPGGNVTQPPAQPPPPPAGTNVTPPANVTQPPSNQTMGQAQQGLTDAQSAISGAAAAGKNVSAAQAKLAEAQAAYDAGDYASALDLASQAKQLALNAAAPPPAAKPPVAPKPTPTPAPTGFDWTPLLLIGIIVILVGALGAGAYLLLGRKKGNK